MNKPSGATLSNGDKCPEGNETGAGVGGEGRAVAEASAGGQAGGLRGAGMERRGRSRAAGRGAWGPSPLPWQRAQKDALGPPEQGAGQAGLAGVAGAPNCLPGSSTQGGQQPLPGHPQPPFPPLCGCSKMCGAAQWVCRTSTQRLPPPRAAAFPWSLTATRRSPSAAASPLQSRPLVTACDARHAACLHLLYGLIGSNRTITEASSVFKNNDLLALFNLFPESVCYMGLFCYN